MCDFCRREDDFLKALKEHKLHICHDRRKGSKTRIDALLKASQEQVTVTPIGEEIALFAAKANLSARAGCNAGLINLLRRVFVTGWQERENWNGKTPIRTMADRAIPNLQPDDVGRAIKQMEEKSKKDLLGVFTQQEYVGLSIDGVKIKNRKFINFDMVHRFVMLIRFVLVFCPMELWIFRLLFRN
jgi:hypothetical protein